MPTREEKLKLIRDKCVKANQEIVHGTTGCDIKSLKTGNVYKFFKWHKWTVNVACVMTDTGILQLEDGEYEIIGRDILAQDVLRTLPYTWMLQSVNSLSFPYEFINVADLNMKSFKNEYIQWKKGTLEDQTDETINQLYKLIENK